MMGFFISPTVVYMATTVALYTCTSYFMSAFLLFVKPIVHILKLLSLPPSFWELVSSILLTGKYRSWI